MQNVTDLGPVGKSFTSRKFPDEEKTFWDVLEEGHI